MSSLKDAAAELSSLLNKSDMSVTALVSQPLMSPYVAAAVVGGGFVDEILINVDQEKIARLGITVQTLGQRLSATNVNLSGGRLSDGTNEYLVRTVNQFETIEDIEETIIFQQGGRTVSYTHLTLPTKRIV